METAVADLLSDIEQQTVLMNGEIVQRALFKKFFYIPQCSNCKYPENQMQWQTWLHRYRDLRCLSHRELKLFEKAREEEKDYTAAEHYKMFIEFERDADWLRAKMREFDPCPNCRDQFNPTHRERKPNRRKGNPCQTSSYDRATWRVSRGSQSNNSAKE